MTVPNQTLVFLPENCTDFANTEVFTLHNSTNIQDKPRVKLFIHDDYVWRLKPHSFSRGASYDSVEDTAKERYVYTDEGKPVKSMLVFDRDDMKTGFLLKDSEYYISLKYDLTYNLISMFYKKHQREPIVDTEMDYVKSGGVVDRPKEEDDKYLTLRDYQDLLIDTMDSNWKYVPVKILERILTNISEEIEEAGDKYYKITEALINKFLLGKVEKIVDHFPKSLPIPEDYPEDIKKSNKYVFSCNLLISLLPKPSYKSLIGVEPIKKHFQKYMKHRKELMAVSKERKIVEMNVMNVGLSNGSVSNGNYKGKIKKLVKKTVVTKKNIPVGRGAIDGFFKRAK